MYIDTTFPPPGSGRLAQFMRLVEAFERDEIETAVDALIARLDTADGDNDVEPNGDELDQSYPEALATVGAVLRGRAPGIEDAEEDDEPEDDGDERDGTASEDDFMAHMGAGAGCPVSDPGDAAYVNDSGGKQPDVMRTYGGEDDEPSNIASLDFHRARIQRTRCSQIVRRGQPIYTLRTPCGSGFRP